MIPLWLLFLLFVIIIIWLIVINEVDCYLYDKLKQFSTISIVILLIQFGLVFWLYLQAEYLLAKCADNNITLIGEFEDDVLDYKAEKYRKTLENLNAQ